MAYNGRDQEYGGGHQLQDLPTGGSVSVHTYCLYPFRQISHRQCQPVDLTRIFFNSNTTYLLKRMK